jgi:hypothetical protein
MFHPNFATLQQIGHSSIVTSPSRAPALANALVTRILIVTYQNLEQTMMYLHASTM